MDNLEQMLDKQVEHEFAGVLEYDEIIEKMPKEHTQHVDMLRQIQKEQSIHMLELVNMIMDMGFKEPKIIQELEEFVKKKGYAE